MFSLCTGTQTKKLLLKKKKTWNCYHLFPLLFPFFMIKALLKLNARVKWKISKWKSIFFSIFLFTLFSIWFAYVDFYEFRRVNRHSDHNRYSFSHTHNECSSSQHKIKKERKNTLRFPFWTADNCDFSYFIFLLYEFYDYLFIGSSSFLLHFLFTFIILFSFVLAVFAAMYHNPVECSLIDHTLVFT